MDHQIGLVLGAGGIVGHAWHVGVLAALEEATGWDPRRAGVVVGTSAGSVVGTMVRAGLSATDLFAASTGRQLSPAGAAALGDVGRRARESATGQLPRPGGRYAPASPTLVARAALRPWQVRPGHLVAGMLPRGTVDTSGMGDLARHLHDGRWPEAPLWLCTVTLRDGHRVVLGRDDVGDVDIGTAVEASCAIPGYFRPVEIGGRDHVDGGVHSPTNADVVAGIGLDLVVVSSPMSLDRRAVRRPAVDRMARIGHRMALQREVTVVRDDRTEVLSLQPGPEDIAVLGHGSGSMDPERRRPVAERARETTLRRLASDRLRGVVERLPG